MSPRTRARDRAPGATTYTLNQFAETTTHASGTGRLNRLCAHVADGRLDGQGGLEHSWREPAPAPEALLHRRIAASPIGGTAPLRVD